MALSKFLKAVVDKLPADQQVAATALFEAHPDALAAAAELDGRVEEHDVLTKWRTDLDTWSKAKEAEFAVKASGTPRPADRGNPNPNPNPDANNTIDKKTFDLAIQNIESQGTALMGYLTGTALRHFQAFGEVLDVDALLKNPRANQIGVKALYEETYKPRYDAKAKEVSDARDEQLRKEGRELAMKEFAGAGGTNPYPIPRPGAAPIDGFQPGATKPDGTTFGVDAAVAAYNALVAGRPN